MIKQKQQHLVLAGQWLTVAGLSLTVIFNLISLLWPDLYLRWWVGFLFPIPGLLLWLVALAAPWWQAKTTTGRDETYRLVYDAPAQWCDETARTALLNLVDTGVGLDIWWVREGEGVGCWLGVSTYGEVLERLVGDVFPAGGVEPDQSPLPGEGVVILTWRAAAPSPVELCRLEGVDGVYYRRRSAQAATVALWGPGAAQAARQWADPGEILAGQDQALLRPKYVGTNPWPQLPPFPASQGNPGLAAVSRLEKTAPALRVSGRALMLGRDGQGARVGFGLPAVTDLRTSWVFGRLAEQVVVALTCQAVQRAKMPVLFFDGRGTAVTALARKLLREVALGQAYLCDTDRPAQSRLRLNPLWLPADESDWPRILATGWVDWLRELGVTPGGLGQAAYRYSLTAVVLTALATARQAIGLDVRGLWDALKTPDYLSALEESLLEGGALDEATRTWWLAEGRTTSTFDAHLRLGHLRDRLSTLLELPEYRLLWQGPYLDPLTALNNGTCGLFWRLPDPRRRLRPYITSQLAAIATLLAIWPAERPVLVILYELEVPAWARQLVGFEATRLVIAGRGVPAGLDDLPPATTFIVSQLERVDAGLIAGRLPAAVRTADLRRLPPGRLVVQQGQTWGTVEIG